VCTARTYDLSAPEIALQNIPHGYATNGSDVYHQHARFAVPLTAYSGPDLALQIGLTAYASDGSPLSPGKTLTLKQIKKKKKNKADKLRKKSSPRRASSELPSSYSRPVDACRVATHSLSAVGDEQAV